VHPLYLTLYGLQVGKETTLSIHLYLSGNLGGGGRGEGGLSLNGDSPVLDIQPVPAHRSTCFRSATMGIRIDSLRVYLIHFNMRYC
jgi:hypothetical protein